MQSMRRKFPAVLFGIGVAALVWFEQRRALRPLREPKLQHDVRNLIVAGTAGLVTSLVEAPVTRYLAKRVDQKRWGLVPRLGLPDVVAVLLLDYTLYLWHVLTHLVPTLWRFHKVHHVDLDLDASTAIRFHFGEMLLSVPYRAAQIVIVGVRPGALSFWQTALFVSILFHHSNLRLPLRVEQILRMFVMTPRLHGIHHSVRKGEQNSNWSSGLTIWDRLHGTLLTGVPQEEIVIGVEGYDRVDQVKLPKLLMLPFV
jgi:sterol desaturase/sphingolipid hydroxylase (fatty acid hydroxylase superfamily)